MHAARTNGGGAPLFGLAYNYWVAIVWGCCAYLNKEHGHLFTEQGQMNTYICGAFAALFAATAAGVNLGGLN